MKTADIFSEEKRWSKYSKWLIHDRSVKVKSLIDWLIALNVWHATEKMESRNSGDTNVEFFSIICLPIVWAGEVKCGVWYDRKFVLHLLNEKRAGQSFVFTNQRINYRELKLLPPRGLRRILPVTAEFSSFREYKVNDKHFFSFGNHHFAVIVDRVS